MLVFYSAAWGGFSQYSDYISASIKNKSDSKSKKSIYLLAFSYPLLLASALFPFALMSKRFIAKLNSMFSLDYSTSYEGGIIVTIISLMAVLVILNSIFNFYFSTLNERKCFLKLEVSGLAFF